ncbi:MAG: hypothetical protein Q4C73_12070, partial [Eubacteriales bacterium]|nr:hypothetical protein [Eubacteriales bacterium]
ASKDAQIFDSQAGMSKQANGRIANTGGDCGDAKGAQQSGTFMYKKCCQAAVQTGCLHPRMHRYLTAKPV